MANHPEYVLGVLEQHMQDFFENIAEDIAVDGIISKADAAIIEQTIGIDEFRQFRSYLENSDSEVEFE